MKNKPLISIIIPTYNVGDILSGCLESVKKQDWPQEKIEIIVVDGGSKDKTMRARRLWLIEKWGSYRMRARSRNAMSWAGREQLKILYTY